ncbi:MAG: hypothetical protein AB1305_02810 [Candidatus Hadarchaeota archaeon]
MLQPRIVRKEARMLPWAGLLAIVVAVAGVSGWLLAPALPAAPAWRIAEVWRSDQLPTAFAGGVPAVAGIENVYIIQHEQGNINQNFGNQPGVWIKPYDNENSVFEGPGDPQLNVPYENKFDIIVAAKGSSSPPSMAYARKENFKIDLSVTGEFTYQENSMDSMEFPFENSNYGTNNGWVRINARFDNNGNGWILRAGTTITFSVTLYLWV